MNWFDRNLGKCAVFAFVFVFMLQLVFWGVLAWLIFLAVDKWLI